MFTISTKNESKPKRWHVCLLLGLHRTEFVSLIFFKFSLYVVKQKFQSEFRSFYTSLTKRRQCQLLGYTRCQLLVSINFSLSFEHDATSKGSDVSILWSQYWRSHKRMYMFEDLLVALRPFQFHKDRWASKGRRGRGSNTTTPLSFIARCRVPIESWNVLIIPIYY